ncbi:hypothetical protein Tco_1210150 [Tanacetum coccineum]
MTTSYSEQGFLSAIYEGKTHQDLHTCLFACFLSQEEPKRVSKALSDPAWVEAFREPYSSKLQKILRKYNYTDVKSASTLTDLEKPLVQDGDAADVDEHLYRSMIGRGWCLGFKFSLLSTSHLLAVKRIFRYLKGKPSLGLWYSKDFVIHWISLAYTDSDYAEPYTR